MESVKGKVVLITGSSSGLGAASAVLFAKYGAKLVVTGRNEERLNKAVEQCLAAGLNKDQVLAVIGDVTVESDMDKLMEATIAKFGTLDVLVNNAGLTRIGTVQELSMEDLDIVYNTNLRSIIYLTKLAIPHLKKTKGAIVNVSSIYGARPNSSRFAYCMFKAGLDMLSKNLALELAGDGVRVNTVRPGGVRTMVLQRIEGFTPEKEEKAWKAWENLNPIGRIGQPEDIAQSIVFLSSDASSFTTGAFLDIDGGISHTAAWTQ